MLVCNECLARFEEGGELEDCDSCPTCEAVPVPCGGMKIVGILCFESAEDLLADAHERFNDGVQELAELFRDWADLDPTLRSDSPVENEADLPDGRTVRVSVCFVEAGSVVGRPDPAP